MMSKKISRYKSGENFRKAFLRSVEPDKDSSGSDRVERIGGILLTSTPVKTSDSSAPDIFPLLQPPIILSSPLTLKENDGDVESDNEGVSGRGIAKQKQTQVTSS